jgi:hypothetical protein
MAETAAHRVDQVFARAPVRPWVLAVPKRLRYFFARDPQRAGAVRLARIYDAFPLACPGCQTGMRLIAFVTDSAAITRILDHLGEPIRPPPVSPARGPPGWEERFDPTPVFDPTAPAPEPDYEFDQRVTW